MPNFLLDPESLSLIIDLRGIGDQKGNDEKGWVPALVLGVLVVVGLNNLLLT